MKPNLVLTLLGAALLAVPASFGQATSGTVGFSTISCPVGTSIVVPTLVNSSVFQGQALISSDGLTVTPSTAPGWTAGAYSMTSFSGGRPNYPRFYVEVVSGAQEGQSFDVSANSTSAITLSSAVPASLSLRGTTVQVTIREHMTLDKLTQGATGLSAYSDAATIFNYPGHPDGPQSQRTFDGTSWLDGDFVHLVGHTVIYPGTGFAFSASNVVTFTMMGEVKPTKTKIWMYSGSTNIVGPINPASSTLMFGNSLASVLSPYADGVNLYSANGAMQATPYSSDGVNVLDRNFVALPSNATDAIPVNRGVVVTVGTDTVWTVNSPLAP